MNKHCGNGNKLNKIINKSNVKLIYSYMQNIASAIKNYY